MSPRRSPDHITSRSRTERGPAAGRRQVVRVAALVLCLALGRGSVEPSPAAAFAASPADGRPDRPAVTRFAMTAAARGSLQSLWRASVQANEERVACLGGARGDDGVVRITRVYALAAASADSANASAAPSLATCRPPRWFGTVHTHIITSPAGEPYVEFSSPDRDVMARWQHAWRAEGVFCLLYSEAAAHCVAGTRGAAIVTYAPPTQAPAPARLASATDDR